MHHLDGAAGQTESHWPKGALASPIGDLVESSSGLDDFSTRSPSSRPVSFSIKPRANTSGQGAVKHVVRTMRTA